MTDPRAEVEALPLYVGADAGATIRMSELDRIKNYRNRVLARLARPASPSEGLDEPKPTLRPMTDEEYRRDYSPRLAPPSDESCAGDPSHQYHSHDDDPLDPALPVEETREYARGYVDAMNNDLAARPAPPSEGLREAGEGYEVQQWVSHQPSGVVVLPGHPQLGGRYCLTDGGDWPCSALRAALTPAEPSAESSRGDS